MYAGRDWCRLKPPKKVRVGPFVYEITPIKEMGATDQAGGVDLSGQAIIYDPGLHSMQERDTILHELLHCIIFQTPLRKTITDQEEEERLVWTLSPRILALLRDNPQFVKYLTEKE